MAPHEATGPLAVHKGADTNRAGHPEAHPLLWIGLGLPANFNLSTRMQKPKSYGRADFASRDGRIGLSTQAFGQSGSGTVALKSWVSEEALFLLQGL